MTTSHSERIILDVETAPLSPKEILEQSDPFDPDSVKLGPRKDPDLIFAYKKEMEARYYNNLNERAALEATTGRVLCVGIWGSTGVMMEGAEEDLLQATWNFINSYPLDTKIVGFNLRSFDIPFLVRRSWKYGINPGKTVFDDEGARYLDRRFIDLMDFWRCGNRTDSISLDRFARFLGLEGKARTGKDFYLLYEQNREEAIAYVKHDLELTRAIADRLL